MVAEFRHDNLTIVAAGLTYSGVLAVLPGLVVGISVIGLFGNGVVDRVTAEVQSVTPGSTATLMNTILTQARGTVASSNRWWGGGVG